MALKDDYEKPYEKHKWQNYLDTTSIDNKINKARRSPLYPETTISYVSPKCAMDVNRPNAYQKNIFVDNNEVYRLIEQSKPTHIQSAIYPEPVIFQRDPLDKYLSYGI